MEKIMVIGNNPGFIIDEDNNVAKTLNTQSTNIDWIYISPIDTVVEYINDDKLVTVPVKKGQIIIQFYNWGRYGKDYSQVAVLDGENTTWINNMNIINNLEKKKNDHSKCECDSCDCEQKCCYKKDKVETTTNISDSSDGDDFGADVEYNSPSDEKLPDYLNTKIVGDILNNEENDATNDANIADSDLFGEDKKCDSQSDKKLSDCLSSDLAAEVADDDESENA